jgi:AbrB family looped-hinge helix DNA binding protein
MRITEKGQVTIPVEIRERFGLLPHAEVQFVVDGDAVKIVRVANSANHGRGTGIARRLRGSATVRMSTDEIMALTRPK